MLTGWKTILVAALLSVLGALQGLNWLDLIPNNQAAVGWIVTGLGALMAVLRVLTTTAVGSKT